MELSASILRDIPKPLAELRPELPRALQKILDRCLAKELTERYPSARELRDAVDRLSRELASGAHATTSSDTGASIAILPFTNMSADPENEFFADGITEEIINALTQIEELRVAARTSAFSFKGKYVDLHIVGERLNVKTVLEGSVRRVGNHVRIMAQLVNVADGYHLWSERYDRELKDIFEVQDCCEFADLSLVKPEGDEMFSAPGIGAHPLGSIGQSPLKGGQNLVSSIL